jgi:hypothetical protein
VRRLKTGAPWIVVAVIGLMAIAAVLAVAAIRTDDSPRGFAQVRATDGGCQVDPARSQDIVTCVRVRDDVYRIVFSREIGERAAIATRETCCPGQVLTTIESDRSVLISLPRERNYPVVFNVVVL